MLFDMTVDRARSDFPTSLQAVLTIGTYTLLLMVQVRNLVTNGVVFLTFSVITVGAI